jgi:hypothetical protein
LMSRIMDEDMGEMLKPFACFHCDFSSGQRGMDRCSVCKGTGSIFVVHGKTFSNTEEGYNAACKEAKKVCWGHREGPDELEEGPWNRAGVPKGRRCIRCQDQMQLTDYVVQRVCEPVQIWVDWFCNSCKRFEFWSYEDTYMPGVGDWENAKLPIEKKIRWRRSRSCRGEKP